MKAAKSDGKTSIWRSDAFIGAAALVTVLIAHQATNFFGTLERRFYDYSSTHTQRAPSDRIAVIAIDDASISRIGRWPWSRDVHAELIEKLSSAKPKSIAYTAFFFEPQTDRGLVYIKKMRELFRHRRKAPPMRKTPTGSFKRFCLKLKRLWTRTESWQRPWDRPETCCCHRYTSSANRAGDLTSRWHRLRAVSRSVMRKAFLFPQKVANNLCRYSALSLQVSGT